MITSADSRAPTAPPPTIVQCDFDGTITIEDASFIMLDAYARGDWHKVHDLYEASKISVGRFNEDAFGLVGATREQLLDAIKGKVAIRAGFPEFVLSCRERGFRLVVVSNGLDFYIHEILEEIGFPDIEVHGATTRFYDNKVAVQYVGPDGKPLDDAFKEAYVSLFLGLGYRVAYVGNSSSDYMPAKKCHRIFATGTLLETCHKAHLDCIPFSDFYDIVKAMEMI